MKKKERIKTAEQEEMTKFVIVLLVVLICVGGIYLLTRAFVTKDLFNNNTQETSTGKVNNRTDDAKLHMYIVDLNNKLNADYYNPQKENKKATDVSSFMFGDKTLLKIKGGKVEKYITDLTKIKEELNPKK